MKYPEFLKSGGSIGLVAPSFGSSVNPYRSRLDNAVLNFRDLGMVVKKGKNIYKLDKAQSETPKKRAHEFMNMYLDTGVDFVLSVAGGEIMNEILPYIGFKKIKEATPKFFMGYSDNTILTFLLPTICDIASIYGINACDFGMKPWHDSVSKTFQIMKGANFLQESFSLYEDKTIEVEDPLAPYQCCNPVSWVNSTNEDVFIEGRIIGGCLDVLTLFCGTKYDKVKAFNTRYEKDGIIWFFESCDLNSLAFRRALWQLKQAGWFKHVKGFIIGRPENPTELFDVSYMDSCKDILGEYEVPIILNADIGHLAPTMTIICGSIVKIKSEKGKGTIETILK